jgi:hypothetical protein
VFKRIRVRLVARVSRVSFLINLDNINFNVHAINKMSHHLDVQRLEFAFQGRPDIIGAIQKAAGLTIPKPPSLYQPCQTLQALSLEGINCFRGVN